MSGQFGFHTGVTGHGGTAADRFLQGASRGMIGGYEFTCLPRLMRNNGMHTALISPSGERHSACWVYAGFHEMHNTGRIGNECDEATCHIPMIIKWNEGEKGAAYDGLHYNLDLLPTLADLMQQEKPEVRDGRSYAETILNGTDTAR